MDLIAKAVTLKSIKLNDPTAKNLLFSAKHAVLYSFDPRSSSWEKTETEGCLAIYKRAKLLKTLPSVSVLFILNRLRPENFSCPLGEVESVQLEGDLLMLLLKNSTVMGIWLFDEKERQLALNVLQSILTGNSEDEDEEEDESNFDKNSSNSAQLKSISVADLLGGNDKEKPPSILEILSKAKGTNTATEPTKEPVRSLENAISDHFEGNLSASTSLKSFTNSVCEFLQANPQVLTTLHRKLTNNKKRS